MTDRAVNAVERLRIWARGVGPRGPMVADQLHADLRVLLAAGDEVAKGLEWALDVLEITLRRLDTLEEHSPEHHRIRNLGFEKAQVDLAAWLSGSDLNPASVREEGNRG